MSFFASPALLFEVAIPTSNSVLLPAKLCQLFEISFKQSLFLFFFFFLPFLARCVGGVEPGEAEEKWEKKNLKRRLPLPGDSFRADLIRQPFFSLPSFFRFRRLFHLSSHPLLPPFSPRALRSAIVLHEWFSSGSGSFPANNAPLNKFRLSSKKSATSFLLKNLGQILLISTD